MHYGIPLILPPRNNRSGIQIVCLYMNTIAKTDEVGTAHISCIWKFVYRNKNTQAAICQVSSSLLFLGCTHNENTVLQ